MLQIISQFGKKIQSKQEAKYQELIQSGTTPEQEHHMGKRQKHKKTVQQRTKRSALSLQVITRLQGTDKTA